MPILLGFSVLFFNIFVCLGTGFYSFSEKDLYDILEIYGTCTDFRTATDAARVHLSQQNIVHIFGAFVAPCLLYTSPSPRDRG